MTTIDARGFSCPEPLIMLESSLKTESSLEFLVDSKNAWENCLDFAKKQGLSVETEKTDDTFRIRVKRG
ncbi:MAG: sulfurtransferase TusA family protein [Defluviitaleaceae bacterium]|nr:sulfurtransferase TusA family protein [Defluviitaleaceae bacterium]